MPATLDPVARSEWIVCGWIGQIPVGGQRETMILGQPILVTRTAEDGHTVTEQGGAGRRLPVRVKFGCLFTALEEPRRDLPDIPEFDEPDRVIANCGAIGVNTSPYRVIENFIDMAHFSFIHTGLLGTAEETEVQAYRTEHRKDVDEIWAWDCHYVQPVVSRGPKTRNAPAETRTTSRNYRIMSPFSAALFKASEKDPARKNATTIFVQPLTETTCLAYTPLSFVGESSLAQHIVSFQQAVFMQDRIVLENQIPALLPLDPSYELPTRADASSIAFRRWLKAMNMQFGILEKRAA